MFAVVVVVVVGVGVCVCVCVLGGSFECGWWCVFWGWVGGGGGGARFFTIYELLLLFVVFVDLFWGSIGFLLLCFCLFLSLCCC